MSEDFQDASVVEPAVLLRRLFWIQMVEGVRLVKLVACILEDLVHDWSATDPYLLWLDAQLAHLFVDELGVPSGRLGLSSSITQSESQFEPVAKSFTRGLQEVEGNRLFFVGEGSEQDKLEVFTELVVFSFIGSLDLELLPDQVGDKVNEDKDSRAGCKCDVDARRGRLKTLAHGATHFEAFLLETSRNVLGEPIDGVVFFDRQGEIAVVSSYLCNHTGVNFFSSHRPDVCVLDSISHAICDRVVSSIAESVVVIVDLLNEVVLSKHIDSRIEQLDVAD